MAYLIVWDKNTTITRKIENKKVHNFEILSKKTKKV
jgi:hypothetical protein